VTNPFLVGCPPSGGCGVSPGVRCRIGNPRITNEDGDAVHAARRDAARIRTATHGTCLLCGRLMLQMVDPEETRHAEADDTGPIPPCPPLPTDLPTGQVVEYMPAGVDMFVAADVQPDPPEDQPNPPPPTTYDPLPPICPECLAGKCGNCDGQAWDDATDEPAPCACTEEVHDG
jgi:hypothetical protein